MKAKTWAVVILLFLCAVLLVQNMEVVSLKVFFWQISMSRIIAFPLLILLGVIIGFFLGKYAGIGARGR
ncbi:MAG: hypothetical protein P1S46_09590 [bacterium]|nr:hypothetical protein [bacterium]MDT8396079.1 hypothetical protein [bacterium]